MNLILPAKELECERECSHGEDYRLIKLTVTDYNVSPVSFEIKLVFVRTNGLNKHMDELVLE